MAEQEQVVIRPLEEVFSETTVQNLKNSGVNGVIPIGISTAELRAIAGSRGYEMDGVNPHPSRNLGMFWTCSKQGEAIVFFVKPHGNDETVYVLDDEFERFKEVFLEQGEKGN